MKVIGAGFGRTGTMSLKVALEELGAGPCFHCLDPSPAAGAEGLSQAPHQASPWAEQPGSDTEVDWQAALAGWGSTVGWLGARFYREMLDAWPDALVLLSVRDPETWYASARDTINADGPIADRVFGGRIAEREHALGLYHRHNEQVMSTVPPERLLVYEVAQGWEPLSEFLGVQAPQAPFPHLNRAKSLREEAHSPQLSRSETLRRAGSAYASQPARARKRPSVSTARIAGLTVADSPTTFSQEDVLSLLGLKGDEFAERIFARSGVQRRHLNLDADFLDDTLRGRTARVEDELMQYAIQAVDQLGVDPQEIGTVVTASLYSLGCPSLAHRLLDYYEMDPATDKYHISGVGCASAVPLLRLASQSLSQHPGKHSLVVAAESMSSLLTRARAGDQRAKTVGSAIFGDGCGAALLSSAHDAAGPTIVASQVHQIADTLGAVSLALSAEDSYLHLARELPDLAAAGLGELVAGFLHRNRLGRSDVDHWIVHPGGRRIVESVQDVLELSREEVATSWEALAEHGNVGTPSIMYVLKDTIEKRHPRTGEHGLMVTIGPGVSVGLMLLQF
ncbi:MAG TPA: sulfotransferase [Solirubrobacteraceae bacterium]